MSDLTFSSSSTGGMGRLMTFIGTWWISFIPAECTLFPEAIARKIGLVNQQITTILLKIKHGGFPSITNVLRVPKEDQEWKEWNWNFGKENGMEISLFQAFR